MLLSHHDHERIQQAVREAEGRTRGEIVCVVAEEASDYREVPLIWAAAIALAAPSIPLTFLSVVITVREAFFGFQAEEWLSAQSLVAGLAMLASMQFMLFILVVILAFIPPIRRYLTPGLLKREYVRQRAFEQFVGKGLANTADRAGVLIYASLKDRRAELMADTGIDEKVGKAEWDAIIRRLVQDIRAGKAGDGFVTAIRNCADHLARHFPAIGQNPNELPDNLTHLPRSPARH
jgi:putative membrane protein